MIYISKTTSVFFIFLMLTGNLFAQISLAPSILFINDNSNVGEFYLTNISSTTQEINIFAEFGYPSSDETGTLLGSNEVPEISERYGIQDNIRVFPRRLILQPGVQQTIRVQVLNTREKEDGLYWTRITVRSNEIQDDIDQLPPEQGLGTRIDFVFNQNFALFYRKGIATTGVTVDDLNYTRDENSLVIEPRLRHTGNSPYLGSMFARLLDQNGEVVAENRRNAFIYFEELRRISIDVSELESGRYTLELKFETSRRDVASQDLVQAPPVVERFTVEL